MTEEERWNYSQIPTALTVRWEDDDSNEIVEDFADIFREFQLGSDNEYNEEKLDFIWNLFYKRGIGIEIMCIGKSKIFQDVIENLVNDSEFVECVGGEG